MNDSDTGETKQHAVELCKEWIDKQAQQQWKPAAPLPERAPELGRQRVLRCIANLPRITEVNVGNLLDRITTISKQHCVNFHAESGITYRELTHVFSASMLHNQETAGGRSNTRWEDVFQDADFASWVGIVKAPAPQPGRRPAAAIPVCKQWMVSKQHERDPPSFGLPVLADPAH